MNQDGTMTATQKNNRTRRTRTLHRFPVTDHFWEFQENSTTWHRIWHSEFLESRYQSNPSSTAIDFPSPFGFRLTVNFASMIQINLDTYRRRMIRRVQRTSAALSTQPSNTICPSTAQQGAEQSNNTDFSLIWRELKGSDTVSDNCAICLDEMKPGTEELVEPLVCKRHVFHKACVMCLVKNNSLKCPICLQVSGAPETGNQPNGHMNVRTVPNRIQGSSCDNMFMITYDFSSGIQGTEHPSPGAPYRGTSRVAYLPATAEGREVLKLLKTAWERRLIFTIGTSITTGISNSVVWTGIHHKTSTLPGPYGYPDPTYLSRVKSELSQRGVS